MSDKQEEDTLMKAFDALDADLGKLLAHYRKLKRDRRALLEACRHLVAVLTRQGNEPDADVVYATQTLKAAIAQAESEE